jgi:hypothetical protein
MRLSTAACLIGRGGRTSPVGRLRRRMCGSGASRCGVRRQCRPGKQHALGVVGGAAKAVTEREFPIGIFRWISRAHYAHEAKTGPEFRAGRVRSVRSACIR